VGIGRALIIAGAVIVVLGILVTLGERFPIGIGRLPGDFVIRGKNSVFYFPLATCLLLSVIGTLVMWLFRSR
jgi:hypothetical protein